MTADFYKLFINLALIGVMVVALFSFGTFLQADNNVSDPFIDNQLINESYGTLQTSLGGLRDSAQGQKNIFESENPTAGFGSILLFSIVSFGRVFNGMVVGIFNVVIQLPVVVLGFDPIIVSVLSTILILTIIIGVWIVYKLGG